MLCELPLTVLHPIGLNRLIAQGNQLFHCHWLNIWGVNTQDEACEFTVLCNWLSQEGRCESKELETEPRVIGKTSKKDLTDAEGLLAQSCGSREACRRRECEPGRSSRPDPWTRTLAAEAGCREAPLCPQRVILPEAPSSSSAG